MSQKIVKNDIDKLLKNFSLFHKSKIEQKAYNTQKRIGGTSIQNSSMKSILDKLNKLDIFQINRNLGTSIKPVFSTDIDTNQMLQEHIQKCYEAYNFIQLCEYIYENISDSYNEEQKFNIAVIAHASFSLDYIISVHDKDVKLALNAFYDASVYGYYKLCNIFITNEDSKDKIAKHLLSIEDTKQIPISSKTNFIIDYTYFLDGVIEIFENLN